MSGFANGDDLPYLLGFIAVAAVLTSLMAIVTRRLLPNASNAAVAIGSGLALPLLIFALGFALLMLLSAGESPDGPAMLFAGVVGLAIISLPICLLTSAFVISIRRR